MRELLTILAGILVLVSPLPYIIDIIRNKTHPNMVTWVTWSLINSINTAAAFKSGAWQTGLFGLCGTLATVSIATLALWHGVKKYTAFDVTCQIIALLGIPLWVLTGQPALAVLLVLGVDFSGGLPTLRHAWKAPQEETLKTFALTAVAGLLLLLSLNHYTFIAVAMPLYILLFDSAIVFAIAYGRHAARQKQP